MNNTTRLGSRRPLVLPLCAFVMAGLAVVLTPGVVAAQSLGSFTWQLQPFCNRITVTVIQTGGSYTIDGFDDQCGSSQRAPVAGVATLNPNGTIAIGVTTIVNNALPVHINAQVSLPSASGVWQDNFGNTGPFVLGGVAAGSPRPLPTSLVADGSITTAKLAADAVDSSRIAPGAVGGADINEAEVQRRVTATCTGGQLMSGVNADGTVVCTATGSGAGDITAVSAGAGLTGGGTSGDVALAVDTAAIQSRVTGVCAPGTAARAVAADGTVTCETVGDITAVTAGTGLTGGGATGAVSVAIDTAGVTGALIAAGAVGTTQIDATQVQRRVGSSCLAGTSIRVVNQDGTVTCETSSGDITAVVAGAGLTGGAVAGDATLAVSFAGGGVATTAARTDFYEAGTNNTAVGLLTLANVVGGESNTAIGRASLEFTTGGQNNTALGNFAARGNQIGNDNTAIGAGALLDVSAGNNNIAIGSGSGGVVSTGSDNIYIQADAAGGAEAGTLRLGSVLSRAFIAGIRGVSTDVNDAIAVVIDSNGQLGTVSSSRRTKDNILDLGAVSRNILDLRPVQFTYKAPFANGTTPVQYGLIAEEVEAVMPELVAYGKDGQVETVKYHVLPTLLLAEVQRLERERAEMARDRDELAARLAALEKLVAELTSSELRKR